MIDTHHAASAPDFTMTDADGKTVRLSDYRGKKNIVLVFNRGFS
jgi:peroxiredoxin